MIGTLESIPDSCLVAKIPKWCYFVQNLSRSVEGVVAKLGADVTVAESFSESGLGESESRASVVHSRDLFTCRDFVFQPTYIPSR